MTDDEFVKEFCSKCINRKGFDDVCEIRKNIKGEPQCMNFDEEKKKEKNKMEKDLKIYSKQNGLIYEKTYIQKQQFIEMLQNLNFVAIEKANIDFITMYKIDAEKDVIEPKGFKIELY